MGRMLTKSRRVSMPAGWIWSERREPAGARQVRQARGGVREYAGRVDLVRAQGACGCRASRAGQGGPQGKATSRGDTSSTRT